MLLPSVCSGERPELLLLSDCNERGSELLLPSDCKEVEIIESLSPVVECQSGSGLATGLWTKKLMTSRVLFSIYVDCQESHAVRSVSFNEFCSKYSYQ